MIHNGRINQPAQYNGRPVTIVRRHYDSFERRWQYTVRDMVTGQRWVVRPVELERVTEVER